MFKILDGREQFYQWDLNRQLLVQDASITEVHFCNRTEECSLVVEVKDGVADVPNILLQDNFRIKVYGYDGEATKHSATFGVIARSKPADYIYTETEVKSYEDFRERLAANEEAITALGEEIKEIDVTESIEEYVDTYVETTDVWSYSKDNLIKEDVLPSNQSSKAYNATASKISNTTTGVYTLYINLKVYLARKRNGKLEEIAKYPYSIVEDESGMLIIEDTANTIEAAAMFGTPDNKYTFTDIINSMVGTAFTDYKVTYNWVRSGTDVKNHAVGLSARLELYGNNEAVVDSVLAEVNTLLAQATHILFYYKNTPFNLIEGG